MCALSPSSPIQTADRNGMDKEDIEARAQEFVALFERCKGLSRSSATASIASCLQDLQIFLESIDHWRRHNPPVGSQRSEVALEAFPSLGPLLLQLGRNPVVLASASLSDPLAKTLLWYSGQGDSADGPDRPRVEDTWMEERRWCASRIQDMCRRQGQLSKSLRRGYQQQPEAKKAVFEELFGVQEQELEEQVLDQTIDSLSEALQGLASMMSIKPLTTSVLTFMIKWNSQLSALCAPMIPILRAHGLIQGTIKTAHQLWTKAQTCSLSVTRDSLLDATFVEQIMAHQDKGSLTEILCGNYFTEFFTIAPLARRRNLMLIMDEILVACQEQPDFYSSPKTIIQQHFEKSKFLTISSTKFRISRDFVHLLLQDAAALSGEIDDWRLVRIWTLLVGWIIGQAGPKETEVDRFQGEDEAAFIALDASEEFLKLLIARMASLEFQWKFFSTETLAERDVRGILWAQRNYIYRSAHPEQLLLRKRLAFLIGAATNNLIVHMVCNCFHSAARLSRQTTEVSTSSTPVQSATALLLAGNSVVMESDLQLDVLSGQFAACLRALQELCFVCKRDPQAKRGLQVPLESILDQYAPVLNRNQPLMADIICGMGIYIGQDDRRLWNSLIQAVLSRASPGLQGANTSILSAPILTRLRDIAEMMSILDLDFTLNTLLATD
ncbi:hypothetical protein KVV02_007298 [Mortierella alpina]|uniref:Uncharacterized protein n=1 Tax=Mortierella alpina TaxID=64518 RepID=A0A9P8CZ09_MORAP|nr:hypothetical protein KVV02_007298 [Mortierella alpina]